MIPQAEERSPLLSVFIYIYIYIYIHTHTHTQESKGCT